MAVSRTLLGSRHGRRFAALGCACVLLTAACGGGDPEIPLATVGALLAKPAFAQVRKRLDWREYGGGPLLGVDGVVIVAHGRSDSLAIKNAIRVAKQAVEEAALDAIRNDIAQSIEMLAKE